MKAKRNPDGSVTVTFPKDFMGHCHCGKPAKHKQWSAFDPPLPASADGMFPEVKGTWTFVCDEHVSTPNPDGGAYPDKR